MKKNKVLVLVPPLSNMGGISNYYSTLKPLFSQRVEYCYRGTRNQKGKRLIKVIFRFVSDLFIFAKKLHSGEYALVHINTSLSVPSFFRDSLYIIIARFYKVTSLPFFRGWLLDAERTIKGKYKWLLRVGYLKCPGMITLSSVSKNQIMEWGFEKDIYLETTLIDESLIKGFDFEEKQNIIQENPFRILFLARVEMAKGLEELFDAFDRLCANYNDIKLIIAGSGTADDYVAKRQANNSKIDIIGYVRGDDKAKVFEHASIYVLPSYTEGMPNSLLEAMSFALPLVCTPGGGIKDVVADGVNGIFVSPKSTDELYKAIERLYLDRELASSMSLNNYKESERFYSRNVVRRLEDIYDKLIESTQQA